MAEFQLENASNSATKSLKITDIYTWIWVNSVPLFVVLSRVFWLSFNTKNILILITFSLIFSLGFRRFFHSIFIVLFTQCSMKITVITAKIPKTSQSSLDVPPVCPLYCCCWSCWLQTLPLEQFWGHASFTAETSLFAEDKVHRKYIIMTP